jgi:hypothetical protein
VKKEGKVVKVSTTTSTIHDSNEQLMIIPLIKKPLILQKLQTHCRVYKSPPFNPILSQLNPLHSFKHYAFKTFIQYIFLTYQYCAMPGSHGAEYEDDCLLGCSAAETPVKSCQTT